MQYSTKHVYTDVMQSLVKSQAARTEHDESTTGSGERVQMQGPQGQLACLGPSPELLLALLSCRPAE